MIVTGVESERPTSCASASFAPFGARKKSPRWSSERRRTQPIAAEARRYRLSHPPTACALDQGLAIQCVEQPRDVSSRKAGSGCELAHPVRRLYVDEQSNQPRGLRTSTVARPRGAG